MTKWIRVDQWFFDPGSVEAFFVDNDPNARLEERWRIVFYMKSGSIHTLVFDSEEERLGVIALLRRRDGRD